MWFDEKSVDKKKRWLLIYALKVDWRAESWISRNFSRQITPRIVLSRTQGCRYMVVKWTSNVRYLFIIRSNFFIKRKITLWFDKKTEDTCARDFSRQITQFRTALCDLTRKKLWIFARRKLTYTREFSSNHTKDTVWRIPLSSPYRCWYLVAKCKYRKALYPRISILVDVKKKIKVS